MLKIEMENFSYQYIFFPRKVFFLIRNLKGNFKLEAYLSPYRLNITSHNSVYGNL